MLASRIKGTRSSRSTLFGTTTFVCIVLLAIVPGCAHHLKPHPTTGSSSRPQPTSPAFSACSLLTKTQVQAVLGHTAVVFDGKLVSVPPVPSRTKSCEWSAHGITDSLVLEVIPRMDTSPETFYRRQFSYARIPQQDFRALKYPGKDAVEILTGASFGTIGYLVGNAGVWISLSMPGSTETRVDTELEIVAQEVAARMIS